MIPLPASNFFLRSQIFVAVCACALSAETFLVVNTKINFVSIAVVFFGALFIYNASRLSISIFNNTGNAKYTLQLDGDSLSIVICGTSLLSLFGLLTACSWMQVLVFMGTSVLSLFYMMPFKKNGIRMQGLRNNLFLKNVVLSLIWAAATVLFPIAANNEVNAGDEIVFMFLRRFFFIYALTVVYDLRDLEADRRSGMQTVALRYGLNKTRAWSLTALLFFVIFTLADPNLQTPQMHTLSTALLWSAVAAILMIIFTKALYKKTYYPVVVDAVMAIQFILVLVFRQS